MVRVGEVWHYYLCQLPLHSDCRFLSEVNCAEDELRETEWPPTVGGGINVKAVEWSMKVTEARRRRFLEMAVRLGLNVAHISNTTTFRKPADNT